MKKLVLTPILISIFTMIGLAQTSLRVGENAPIFSAASLDGAQYDLNELRGSVVVLTFWSSKCYICQQEFPKMNQVVRSFDGKKVAFLSLTMESEDRVESFLKSNEIVSTIVPNSFGVLLKYADRDKRGHLEMGFPSYFVIDQQGVLKYRSSGWNKTGQISETINSLIQ